MSESLCPDFEIPYSVVSAGTIYLIGYSYYRVMAASLTPLPPILPSRADAVIELRFLIRKGDLLKVREILDANPSIPRQLTDDRGRCDNDIHEALFTLLLGGSCIKDLERIYGVLVASDDEAVSQELISQRETFGSRVSLIHERVSVSRDNGMIIRGLKITRQVGKGSFGYVFEDSDKRVMKFSMITAEYTRELLSHCALLLTCPENESITHASGEMIQHHLLELYPLTPFTRSTIMARALSHSKDWPKFADLEICGIDRVCIMVRELLMAVRNLRDRFIMHLDLSTSNVMYDTAKNQIRIIDYGGTIGDDSFFDVGTVVSRVCTRSTRAPEYGSSDTLWQRNESSEALSAYYAVMSNLFRPELLNDQPYIKDRECYKRVCKELEDWDNEWKLKTETAAVFPPELQALRRVHLAARRLPRDRPPLDWILDGDEGLETGRIGSATRQSHIRGCLARFVTQWPKGIPGELSPEWKERREFFINLLVGRIDCHSIEGTTCAGIAAHHSVPPPYTLTRCIALYDALRDVVIDRPETAELAIVRYMSEMSCYPILVNSIVYLSLAASKASLVDVEHYGGHPLHVVLRAMIQHPNLVSVFLSPITAYILLVLEGTTKMSSSPEPGLGTETSHRIIRCLYNLHRDRRCQPMHGAQLARIVNFVREYANLLVKTPLVIETEADWWKFLRVRSPRPPPRASSGFPSPCVENVIRLWFT